jgi:hypothetical protein
LYVLSVKYIKLSKEHDDSSFDPTKYKKRDRKENKKKYKDS